uniref:Domain of unknown function DB domain-containing protein n=1 Tax=Romanomermis culicivorax TaxID=13658 RepID=A0A915HT22_ROMCU
MKCRYFLCTFVGGSSFKTYLVLLSILVTFLLLYAIIVALISQDAILESEWKNGIVPLARANQMYRNCCKAVDLKPGCFEACRYDLTLKTAPSSTMTPKGRTFQGPTFTVKVKPSLHSDPQARHVFFENQDQNMCDLNDSIERFVRCANGIKKPKDIRQCCLKMGATTKEGSSCDVYCDPKSFQGIGQMKRPVHCALTFRRILYCHYINLEE